MSWWKGRSPVLLALALPLLGGCEAVAAASAAGLTVIQQESSEVSRDFDAMLDEVYELSLESLRQLEYPEPALQTKGRTVAEIEGEDVLVRIQQYPAGVCRIRVRAGRFRSEENLRRAERILDEVARLMSEEAELREWSRKVQALTDSDE